MSSSDLLLVIRRRGNVDVKDTADADRPTESSSEGVGTVSEEPSDELLPELIRSQDIWLRRAVEMLADEKAVLKGRAESISARRCSSLERFVRRSCERTEPQARELRTFVINPPWSSYQN